MFKDGGREFHSITNSGEVVEKKREIVEIVVSLCLREASCGVGKEAMRERENV